MRSRLLRWFILAISLIVELIVFLWAGPDTSGVVGFWNQALLKLNSPTAWAAVGWASLTLFFVWHELVRYFYSNGRRLRNELHDKELIIVHETGLHWLVLWRDIRIGKLYDANEKELNTPIFDKTKSVKSYHWFVAAIVVAALTAVYFAGWFAWVFTNRPDIVQLWPAQTEQYLVDKLGASFSPFAKFFADVVDQTSALLEIINSHSRDDLLSVLMVLLGGSFLFSQLAGYLGRVRVIHVIMHVASIASLAGGIFAIFSTSLFGWLQPLYEMESNVGPAAMGFFLLTLVSATYVSHLLAWSSWRYGVIGDPHSQKSKVVIVGGVLGKFEREFDLQEVIDQEIRWSLWERLLDVGNIVLIDKGGQKDMLWHVAGVYEFKRHIAKSKTQHDRAYSRSTNIASHSVMFSSLADSVHPLRLIQSFSSWFSSRWLTLRRWLGRLSARTEKSHSR